MSAANGNLEISSKIELYIGYVLLAVIIMLLFAVAAFVLSIGCPVETRAIENGCVEVTQGFIKSVQCSAQIHNNIDTTRSLD